MLHGAWAPCDFCTWVPGPPWGLEAAALSPGQPFRDTESLCPSHPATSIPFVAGSIVAVAEGTSHAHSTHLCGFAALQALWKHESL